MCFNDFKLGEKNIFKNTRIHRVKIYAATVRKESPHCILYIYTNSNASATHLPIIIYCFQKELERCSIYSYMYNFVRWTDTRPHRTLSTHSRSSSLFIVKTNSDERADSFFLSPRHHKPCVRVCVYLCLSTGRLPRSSHVDRKNLLTNTAAAGHTTSGRCQALYTVTTHTTADIYVIF